MSHDTTHTHLSMYCCLLLRQGLRIVYKLCQHLRGKMNGILQGVGRRRDNTHVCRYGDVSWSREHVQYKRWMGVGGKGGTETSKAIVMPKEKVAMNNIMFQQTLKMLPKSRPGRPSWTSFLKKFKQATIALPWRREERTRLRVLGRMCSFIVTTEPGLTSITVHSRVSTNWEMWRSLSLIRAGSSSRAVW